MGDGDNRIEASLPSAKGCRGMPREFGGKFENYRKKKVSEHKSVRIRKEVSHNFQRATRYYATSGDIKTKACHENRG